jgi:hypothetical protein
VFNDVVKDGENEENLDKCEIKGAKIFSSQPWGSAFALHAMRVRHKHNGRRKTQKYSYLFCCLSLSSCIANADYLCSILNIGISNPYLLTKACTAAYTHIRFSVCARKRKSSQQSEANSFHYFSLDYMEWNFIVGTCTIRLYSWI